jgi:hypothetical protein
MIMRRGLAATANRWLDFPHGGSLAKKMWKPLRGGGVR